MTGTPHVVSDVMTQTVLALRHGAAFKDIVKALQRWQVSAAPVLDDDGRVVGVVSEADLLHKEEARTAAPAGHGQGRSGPDSPESASVTAAALMTTPAITVRPEAPLPEAARTMARHGVKRLPVVDADGLLQGVVSRADLLKVFLRGDEDIAEEIRRQILPHLFPDSAEPVRVLVRDGVVTLTGRVPDTALIPVAVGWVRGVDGVVAVECALGGSAPPPGPRPRSSRRRARPAPPGPCAPAPGRKRWIMTGANPGRMTCGPFWHWRRNPLRRHSDVVEAWVVLAVWTVTVVGGLLAGWWAGATVDHAFAERRAALHVVSAELTENAKNGTPVVVGYDAGKVWVTVRWTALDGSAHTGLAKAVPTATAGSRLPVWVDRGERVAAPPTSGSETALDSVAAAALVAPLAATAVWGAGRVLRSRLMRRRLAEWDAEWQRIGPQWRNFSGGKG